MMCRSYIAAGLAVAVSTICVQASAQSRVLGIDVSAWQGNISQTTWNNIHNVENRDFVFIRSSRGGTTGFYNQSNPDNDPPTNTFSQRYDDPYFVQNITRATNAGMFAGPYHFGRHDIIEDTLNSGGIANTGTDEANHFIQMAGPWMRPGYLSPVFDLEGPLTRSTNELAQFCIDFSNRIHEVMGIRPVMYINGSYANTLQGASPSLRNELVAGFPSIWTARYAYQSPNYNSPEVQTAHPKDTYSGFYGPWDDSGETHPWDFWQYASTGRLQSFNNGGNNLDFNVAQGGMEFVKDHLVPALWMNDQSGEWTTLANWNSGQAPVAPVQGPGQVPRVGPLTLPTARLPGTDDTLRNVQGDNDTVILNRPNADITVTHASGTHNIRKLYAREALDITGGSLTINYVPSPDSTPISAQFSAPVSLRGTGNLSVHTLQVDAGQTFTLNGGTLTFDTISLMAGFPSGKILMNGDANFNALANATATIATGGSARAEGLIDLDGGDRIFNVANGAAGIDIAINVPVLNGGLIKEGAGTLALGAITSYAGDTAVQAGKLSVSSRILSDTADVLLSTGAILELNFTGAADRVDSLFINGLSQAAGTWGAVGSGAQFTSPFLTGTGMLEVTTFVLPPLPGDYNEDGSVDAADYVVWNDHMGSSSSLPNDDTPGVGHDDYERWRTHFGETAGSGSGVVTNAAVPEPATFGILAAGILFLFLRRQYLA